uniref:Uncharacterized protein n=1 Tax=Oryza glumipatula TaxID=40148 RepID=A0A0E0B7B5_9ORYZ
MTSPSTGEATAGFAVPVCASVVPGEHWSSISATISSRPPFPLVATHVAAFPSRRTVLLVKVAARRLCRSPKVKRHGAIDDIS